MTGWRQRDAIRQGIRSGQFALPSGRFAWVVHLASNGRRITSRKVQCVLCGARGYGLTNPTADTATQWQVAHLMPHPFRCLCGRSYLHPGHLAQHVAAGRWPQAERLRHHAIQDGG